ncbi:MAG: PEGA domain-containing protein [Sandaracinaceae bacterium]|nr:PEGA domain-containing protein [Sandaracinaceae bacterium]
MNGRVIALVVSAALFAAPVSAQDCATAECHVERGLEARTHGDDAAAVGHFEAALRIQRTARALAQLALAEQALGRWVDAEAHLTEARGLSDPWIASHAEVLDGALSTIREHLGTLVVTSNVDGASVRVNGRDAGRLPLANPLSVEVGTAVLEVRADGHVPVQRQTEITAGHLSRVRVDLVARVATDPVDDPDGHPSEVTDPVGPTGPAPSTASSGPSPFLILGAIGAGLTAVALGGTFAALAVREDNVLTWNDPAQCPPFPDGRLVACPDAYSGWNTAGDWAIASGITAGVFAALTVTFFALAAGDSGDDAGASLDVDVGPGRAVLRARGRF